jgi:hypothetical protein
VIVPQRQMLDFSRSGKPALGFNGGAAKSPRLAFEAKNRWARLYNRVAGSYGYA